MTDDFLNEYQRPLPKSAKDDLFRKLKAIEAEETNMTPMTIPATVMRRPAWRSLSFTLASAAAALILVV
ncbi:MAG: hypothetical protein SF123_23945, partial [Chloroflexota bacterium]|nr:hypothetical protein [Chloroflexota bacterium]